MLPKLGMPELVLLVSQIRLSESYLIRKFIQWVSLAKMKRDLR